MNPKDVLANTVNQFKEKCRLVIVYGSYSSKSSKMATDLSDIDFLIVYNKETNPYLYSSLIDKTFRNLGLRYDYSWYVEDDFISTIENGIDYYFWKEIFNTGEILLGDPAFIKRVKEKLDSVDPLQAFQTSIESRRSEVFQSLIDIVRDLHVMLSYCLWIKHFLLKGEIPCYSDLLNKLTENQIIDLDIKILLNKLEGLRQTFKCGYIPSIDIIAEVFKQTQDIIEKMIQSI